jgi:hypothetical protein
MHPEFSQDLAGEDSYDHGAGSGIADIQRTAAIESKLIA